MPPWLYGKIWYNMKYIEVEVTETITRKGKKTFGIEEPTEENIHSAIMDYIDGDEIEFEILSIDSRNYIITEVDNMD